MTRCFNSLRALAVAAFCAASLPAQAALVSVDWTPDGSVDGAASGVFTSTGTVATNATATTISMTSTIGGINGGSTFVPGGLDYINSDYAGGLDGLRDQNGQAFTDANGQPLIRNEIGTFDWLNGQAGFVELDFGGKFLRDPTLVISFIQPLAGYDFADNLAVQVLGETFGGGTSVGPGNVVAGTGFFGGGNAGMAIGLTGVFDSILFGTNAFLSTPSANGLTVFVEESNILLEAPVSPVPLPAALPLLLSALGGLGWMRLRRKTT